MTNTCGACRLPVALRAEIVQQRRRLVPIRRIAEHVKAAGYPLSASALTRHFEAHVPPIEESDVAAAGPDLIVARAARDVLVTHCYLASKLVRRLLDDGAREAAAVVIEAVPETMRETLPIEPAWMADYPPSYRSVRS